MTPALAIVIPSYSQADHLANCLKSVVRLAPENCEILVVDDGSPAALISRTAQHFSDSRLRILRREHSGGFCQAANLGIRTATAPIIELLNDDTVVQLGWAEAALKHFRDPRIGAVAPLVLQSSSGLIDSAGDNYDRGGFAQKRAHNQPAHQAPPAGPVASVSAAAGFYRASVLRSVGGFAEHFGAYFEDVDLGCRIREAGYQAWFEPASVVWHHVSSSYGRQPSRRTLERQSANEERLFWRHGGWRDLPRHTAVLAGKALRRSIEGTLTPWLMGRFRVWCGG